MASTTTRRANTSRNAPASREAESGRRAAGGSVSGCRIISQVTDTAEKTTNAANTPRHPASAISPAPISGATAGTRLNVVITKDMIRAIPGPA